MTQPLRKALLTRILDKHERSLAFGRPAPRPRDIILRIDAKMFPEAFAPEGRRARGLLLAAAAELEADGCIRIERHARGQLAGEAKEIRAGPEEITRAYEAAQALGYERLSSALTDLERHALALVAERQPDWMRTFFVELAEALRRADRSIIGFSRAGLKRERGALAHALTAAVALANGPEPAWERLTSERLFGDSKLLGRIRPLVVNVLLRADPRWEGVPPEEAADLLEAYGVRRKPGLIRCAGAALLHVGGRAYALEDFVPAAHLPDAWSEAWVDALVVAGIRQVTTIENEFPFLSYIEEAGGPLGLASRHEVAVYVGGFPTPQLVSSLASLAVRSEARFQHWGDADAGGLRIWWFLRSRLARPVALLRTTADWVASESVRGGRPLTGTERQALARLRNELPGGGPGGESDESDIAQARTLIDALLASGVKIEQERY